jgi:hypothetical protein
MSFPKSGKLVKTAADLRILKSCLSFPNLEHSVHFVRGEDSVIYLSFTYFAPTIYSNQFMNLHNLRSIVIILFISILSVRVSAQDKKPVFVQLKKTANGFTLLRAGKPYFVKGAGGTAKMDRLTESGGNSIRTWGTDGADKILTQANKLNLTVTMGLDVARERHGFNYDDPAAVKKQLDHLREEVTKYKDYPALLAWGIGNELNLDYKNPKVWDAVNDIAKMIHEVDRNHPATTMLAGIKQTEIDYIKARCPELDFISVQVYGGLAKVPEQLTDMGWKGAYLVTEWGPTGHWECPKTPWKAPIEETSSQKAEVYKTRYEASIAKDKRCLGSYVFLWGQKQERTPTWYGLFTEAGEESEVVDVMQYEWSGHWPANRAPHLTSFKLAGKAATDSLYLEAGKVYPALVSVADPDGDKLTSRWELLPEATDLSQGGDRENRPQPLTGLVKPAAYNAATMSAPVKSGAYRLFVYVTDGKNNVATANIPFFVK